MRVIAFIGHPLFMISIFLLFIVEGDHFGGNYILYLLMALPHGARYAILSVLGIALVVTGHYARLAKAKQFFYLSGLILMIISLIIFFGRSYKTGVDATFYDTVPLISFILLCLSMTCFLIRTIFIISKPYFKPGKHL